MAANTVSMRTILFAMAGALSESKFAWVTARTSNTVFQCSGLAVADNDFYNNALIRLALGTTYVLVTDYTGSTKELTIGSGLTIAVADQVELAWWNADKRGLATWAINEAIKQSWDFWHRDVVVEGASSGITLAAGDDEYDLPAACDFLLEVGVNADAIHWIPPVEQNGRVNYRVEGQTGALVLRFNERYAREGTIADLHTTKGLALHYRQKEPLLTSETGETQLPESYMGAVSAWLYAKAALNDASRLDLQTASINLPQLEQAAAAEINKLRLAHQLPSALVRDEGGRMKDENGQSK